MFAPFTRDAAPHLRTAVHRRLVALLDGARRTESEALRLIGFRGRPFATHVGQVHVWEARREAVSGPTWVFVHGFGSQGADWRPLLRHLRRACRRILVLDLPGHGRSPVPARGISERSVTEGGTQALEALLDDDEQVVLVGNSMGCMGIVRYALANPRRVSGTVLISPAGAPMTDDERAALVAAMQLGSYGDARRLVQQVLGGHAIISSVVALGAWLHLSRPHLQELLGYLESFRFFAPGELAGMPPTLLIWGDRDAFLPKSSRDFFVRELPEHSRVVTPPNFGHSPFVNHGRDVADTILRWARETPGISDRQLH